MTSRRRIEANRRNAVRSTGPRSTAGKLQSSRNALKYGLSTGIANEPGYLDALEKLTRMLAGDTSDLHRLAIARSAAQIELELKRVRLLRTTLLSLARFDLASDAAKRFLTNKETAEPVVQALGRVLKLERYERRAFSRRKRLFRELAQLPALGSG